MPLGPELIEAYRRALYVVYGEPELVIRVGEPNAELDALLEAKGAATAAFVTAANPRGRLAGKTENELAAAALGRAFGQNAIVFVEKGKAPELVILAAG
jgi:hypothetical protein